MPPETDQNGFDRRAILVRIAVALGAAALPVEAFAAPATNQRFLPAARFALLEAVADTLLPITDTPGALAADVPARLDAMLRSWASDATRAAIVGTLGKIDAAALTKAGKSFATLAPTERAAVLDGYDKAALAEVPPPPGAKRGNPYAPVFFVAEPDYLKLKGLVIDLYYYSPVGSDHELEYIPVPGKWQPSLKLTPQSRPFLGLGPF